MNQETREELQRLCYGWCDDQLSAEEVRRLDELLKGNDEAQRFFAEATALNHALEQLGPSLPVTAALPQEGKTATSWLERIPWRTASEVAAGLVALGLILWGIQANRTSESAPLEGPVVVGEEPNPQAVAVLTHTLGAVWPDSDQPLRAGAALGKGRLKLEDGFAHLQFYNGVKLVLEGPAEMEILSLEEANCFAGRFHANVPQHAQGFLIHTPNGELIDHGTEFGLEVSDDASAEVHVFTGEVFYRCTVSEQVTRLRPQEAARFQNDGQFKRFASESEKFASDREIMQLHALDMEYQLSRWNFESRKWREDPGVLVYYDFDQPDYLSGMLPAESSDPYADGQEGVIIGARSTEGRWPGKGGLEFRRDSDRVRVRIPGYYDTLTLTAWVRIDRLEDRAHCLLMSDGFDHGAVQWQFHGGSGTLQLVTRQESEEIATYASERVLDERSVGQWQHLACVYDRFGGEVIHYLNAREVSRQPMNVDVRLRVGVGEIGNWGQPLETRSSQHNLIGVMDEFIVFDRVLTSAELRELVKIGEPG